MALRRSTTWAPQPDVALALLVDLILAAIASKAAAVMEIRIMARLIYVWPLFLADLAIALLDPEDHEVHLASGFGRSWRTHRPLSLPVALRLASRSRRSSRAADR